MVEEGQEQARVMEWDSGRAARKRLLFGLFGLLVLLDVVVLALWSGLDLGELARGHRLAGGASPVRGDRPAYIPEAPFVPSQTPTVTATALPSATSTATATARSSASATRRPSVTWTSEPTLTPSEIPTEAPQATPLPESAQVAGPYGIGQSLALSCEARSAVDWARIFGHKLNEIEFQNALPKTDNPETGFVGSPNGVWGFIPPRAYGVHAGPVADLLRQYGVNARAYRGLGFDDIRREIAEGRPVIVWVVGAVEKGEPVEYTAPDGQTTIVAAFEHTVMAAGYTPHSVLIQDGGYRYYVSLDRFRESWRVLGNMAIFEK